MLSLANVSAAQAENYYEKDDYYTQGDPDLQSDSQWQGNGAEKLGLNGAVDKPYSNSFYTAKPQTESRCIQNASIQRTIAPRRTTPSAPRRASASPH